MQEIEKDKQKLIIDIKKYIEIIKEEYGKYTCIEQNIDFNSIMHIEETKTISLFIRNKEFYFPLLAYSVLDNFKNLNQIMEEEFYNKYYKHNFPGLNGPFEKAKKYNDINYEQAHHYIDEYYSKLGSVPFKK